MALIGFFGTGSLFKVGCLVIVKVVTKWTNLAKNQ